MDHGHLGLDVNGLVDRTMELDWTSGRTKLITSLRLPVVVAPVGDRQPIVVGRAALLHPAGRGWQRPAWTNQDAERRSIVQLVDLPAATAPTHPISSANIFVT
jgi:hypothetical protein